MYIRILIILMLTSLSFVGCSRSKEPQNDTHDVENKVESEEPAPQNTKPAEKTAGSEVSDVIDENDARNENDEINARVLNPNEVRLPLKMHHEKIPGEYDDIDLSYPIFGIPKVDQLISVYIDKITLEAQKQLDKQYEIKHKEYEESELDLKDEELKEYYNLYFELDIRPVHANDQEIDLVVNQYIQLGGVHGTSETQTILFDNEKGEHIANPMSIFKNPDKALLTIHQYAKQTLKENYGKDFETIMEIKKGSPVYESQLKNFVRTNKGIHVYFNPGEENSWSVGTHEFDIPWSAFQEPPANH